MSRFDEVSVQAYNSLFMSTLSREELVLLDTKKKRHIFEKKTSLCSLWSEDSVPLAHQPAILKNCG